MYFSVFLVGLCIVNMQKGFIFLLLPLTIIVLNITCFVSDFASLLLPFMFRITWLLLMLFWCRNDFLDQDLGTLLQKVSLFSNYFTTAQRMYAFTIFSLVRVFANFLIIKNYDLFDATHNYYYKTVNQLYFTRVS